MAEQLPVDYKQQYPTATKIEDGIAYDVSGKKLGPVKGMETDQGPDQSQTPVDASMGGWQAKAPQAADNMGGWKVQDPNAPAAAASTDMGGWKQVGGVQGLQQATISAAKPTVFERLKNAVTKGIPAFNSDFEVASHTDTGQLSTGERPSMQLITPEAAMTSKERQEHPILTGTLEFAGGLTTPETVAIMASTSGLGTLAGPEAKAAAKVIPRLLSGGFSIQQIIGAAKESKEAWDAIKRGDESEALRLITHATLSAGTAILAGQHAAGVEATPSTAVGRFADRAVDRGVQRTVDAVRPDKAALDAAQKRHMIATVAHDARLTEADVSAKQMEQAGQKLDLAQQNLQDGTGTQAEVDAARTNLSKAVANANKAAKAVEESHANQTTARGDIDRLNRNIQRTQTRTDAKKQARDNAAHEDFKHVAPNASDEDLDRSRAYLEEYHSTVEPVKKENGVQTVYDALGWAKRKIQSTIDPYIQRYGKDSIITNPISDVHDKLAENPNATFAETGLSYLEKNYPQLITGEVNVEDAQKLVTQLNAENQATLNPPNRAGLNIKVATLLKTDPEFAARYHAAASLREGMWGLFEDKGISGIDELRRDERAVINVENDVRRNLNKGEVAVRGSGKSGVLRRLGAFALRRGGEAAGAYVGAETFGRPVEGAMVGGYVGEKLGKKVLPGDKTRNQLLERSFQQTGVGKPMSRVSGVGSPSTPGAVRPFEPLRLEGMSPAEMRGIQREYSPLHSELAGYFGKGVDDGSYTDFEKDFKDTVNEKISRGEKLEPEEKNLRKAISDQDAADALKEREQAAKLAALGPAPTATLPEKSAEHPVMDIPNNQNLTPEEIIGHEIAHSIVANKLGIKVTDGVRSHMHASNAADGSHASVGIDLNEFLDEKGKVNVQKLKDKIANVAATFVSGGVYQDLAYNTPFTENQGLNSDLEALQGLMKTVGFTDAQTSQAIAQAAETAGHILSDHLDLIEQHASVREPGLDERYHVSQDRLDQINKDVQNAERYRKSARTTGASEGAGRATTGGREAGVEGRVPEVVRKPGEGTTEDKGRKSAAGRGVEATRPAATAANVKPTPEESAALTERLKDMLARTEGGEEAAPEEKEELADLLRKSIEQAKAKKLPGEMKLGQGQGGHAGGGVASEEELARPGRFVKISRSGAPTDQGKTPDFNLGPGEAGYQVRPGGVYELKAGQETPATKRGVEGYAKALHGKALPTQLSLSGEKTPQQVVEDEGLKYKGELVKGSNVHMFEHPDHPGKTAALEGPLTPESVRTKMASKLREFGVGEREPVPTQLRHHGGKPKAVSSQPLGENDLRDAANEFNKSRGLPEINPTPVGEDPRSSDVADAYKNAVHAPNDPQVKASYDALKRDVKDQYHLAQRLGIKMDVKDENPYGLSGQKPAHEELHDDVRNNKHLSVWSGGAPPADHPLSEVDPETGHTYNELFRMVHDIFGHAAERQDFSPSGEESAWNLHRQMFSPEARPALATETKGQAAYTYKYGDFPPQKAAILPEQFHSRPEDQAAPGGHWSEQVTQKPFGGVNPNNPEAPSKQYGFEIAPEHRHNPAALTAEEAKAYAERPEVKQALASHPDVKLGWDTTTQGPELNVGASTDDLDTAKKIAGKLDQKTIVDTNTGDMIPAGGEGKRTSFPEYPIEERLNDLRQAEKQPGKLPTEMKLSPNSISSRLVETFGTTEDPHDAGFILSNGQMVPLHDTHNTMMDTLYNKYGDIGINDAERTAFINNEQAVRTRYRTSKGGPEVVFSVPKQGITPEQLGQIKNSVGKLRNGNIVMEISEGGGKSAKKEFPRVSDVEPMLRDIGALGKLPTEMKLTPGSSVPLMKNPLPVKGSGEQGRVLTTDVARELNRYSRKANPALELGKAEPEEQTERARDIADDEAKYQLAQGKNGKEWYTTEMNEHDDILKKLRPELMNGPRIDVDTPQPHTAKQGLFKAAEAILSSGQKPYGNLKSTIRAWDNYNETGEFSPLNPNTGSAWGPRSAAAYGNAFEYLNDLVKKHGEKGAVEWLLNEHPISELRTINEDVKGRKDETAPGALILGPKRGPFMQNLHGIESAFTADRWVSRTWNRWMGTLDPSERGGLVGDYVMDRPRNKTEHSLMKQSFSEAADNIGLSTSSLQAVLWYYEQALYSAHGVPKESWSFADAARRVQQEEAQRELFGKAEEFPFGASKETPEEAGRRAFMEKLAQRPSTFVNLKGNK